MYPLLNWLTEIFSDSHQDSADIHYVLGDEFRARPRKCTYLAQQYNNIVHGIQHVFATAFHLSLHLPYNQSIKHVEVTQTVPSWLKIPSFNDEDNSGERGTNRIQLRFLFIAIKFKYVFRMQVTFIQVMMIHNEDQVFRLSYTKYHYGAFEDAI